MTRHACAAAAVRTTGAAWPESPSGRAAATATTISAASSASAPLAAATPTRLERSKRDICLPFVPGGADEVVGGGLPEISGKGYHAGHHLVKRFRVDRWKRAQVRCGNCRKRFGVLY